MLRATADSTNGQELKKEVEEAIAEFGEWFEKDLKNERLSNPERAILDTFCYWMVAVRGKKEGDPKVPSP
jgi:hypothetical protein